MGRERFLVCEGDRTLPSSLSSLRRLNLWFHHWVILTPLSLASQLSVAACMVRYRIWRTPQRVLLARSRIAAGDAPALESAALMDAPRRMRA